MLYDVLLDDDIPAELREDSCNCDGGLLQEMLCVNCEDSRGVGNLKQPPKIVPAAGSKTKYKAGGKFEMNWRVDLDPGWLPDSKKT